MRLPWQSNGSDSPRPLQRAQVQSLVRKLGSHMLHGLEKKKNLMLLYLFNFFIVVKYTNVFYNVIIFTTYTILAIYNYTIQRQ